MRDSNKAIVPWAQNDQYMINLLIQNYDGNDTFYIPYIDEIATGSQVSKSILYADTTRTVIVRVRDVQAATPIQVYEAVSEINETGMSVRVNRLEDEVYV
jgi:hypothetical protein